MARPKEGSKTLQIIIPDETMNDLQLLAAISQTKAVTLMRLKLDELLAEHRDRLERTKEAAKGRW